MEKKYILAIDQSTSGTKAILFSRDCLVRRRVTIPHAQIHPRSGWVEHDPEEIWENVRTAIMRVMQEGNASWDEVDCISVTNQRETGMVWNAETGRPVHPAIVWQCPRAREICQNIAAGGKSEKIFRKTGLRLSPYFTAPKVSWILDNVPEARKLADSGLLRFGTMDSWVILNLTGGRIHATDYSNASRTMLMNLNTLAWDEELLAVFGIPLQIMPEIKPSDSIFGHTAGDEFIPAGIPISGIMGDSHAALFGQNCYRPGMTKATYGTGSSVMMNIGSKPVFSENGIVTSVGWVSTRETVFVLEGNINSTGKTIEWLVENTGLLSSPKEAGDIALKVRDNGGVYFVPAFTGLGAPYWDNDARALITGLNFGTVRENIIRAAEESIAYQIADVLELMQLDAGLRVSELRADGGPTRDKFLMQFQSDILRSKVVVPWIEELSALGSANMAGLATGFWSGAEEIEQQRRIIGEFVPSMDEETRHQYKEGWKNAVRQALEHSGKKTFMKGDTAYVSIWSNCINKGVFSRLAGRRGAGENFC